jgi:hypothetical protein
MSSLKFDPTTSKSTENIYFLQRTSAPGLIPLKQRERAKIGYACCPNSFTLIKNTKNSEARVLKILRGYLSMSRVD